ncbi:MAG: hypothetical protein EBZ77_05150 [Chitinophagia bacterium]|nr:hypothetical protein [Chitinophagia bacterium]
MLRGGSAPYSAPTTPPTVFWMWESDNGKSFIDFLPDHNNRLEIAYQSNQKGQFKIPENNWHFNFATMIQQNTITRRMRRIERRLVPSTDSLCDLIYRNTPISAKEYRPYFSYTIPECCSHYGGFNIPTDIKKGYLNGSDQWECVDHRGIGIYRV